MLIKIILTNLFLALFSIYIIRLLPKGNKVELYVWTNKPVVFKCIGLYVITTLASLIYLVIHYIWFSS